MSLEIGGYLDVGANRDFSGELFSEALTFNSCANALEFLVRARGYPEIRVPVYICPEVRRAAEKAGAKVLPYVLDQNFRPVLPADPGRIPIVYVNYFGLMDDQARSLANSGAAVIVDNAQAFFSPPLPGLDCVYSPRKFFGLPDGGLLCPGAPLEGFADLAPDNSFDRCAWLFKRLECGAASAYEAMRENERTLRSRPPMRMSASTRWLLAGCDLEYAAGRRRANWEILHEALGEMNAFPGLQRKLGQGVVPLCYPFLPAGICAGKLRTRLIAQKIFVPRYWPGLEAQAASNALEHGLVYDLLPLPLDQRYGGDDMERMLKILFQEMTRQ